MLDYRRVNICIPNTLEFSARRQRRLVLLIHEEKDNNAENSSVLGILA